MLYIYVYIYIFIVLFFLYYIIYRYTQTWATSGSILARCLTSIFVPGSQAPQFCEDSCPFQPGPQTQSHLPSQAVDLPVRGWPLVALLGCRAACLDPLPNPRLARRLDCEQILGDSRSISGGRWWKGEIYRKPWFPNLGGFPLFFPWTNPMNSGYVISYVKQLYIYIPMMYAPYIPIHPHMSANQQRQSWIQWSWNLSLPSTWRSAQS